MNPKRVCHVYSVTIASARISPFLKCFFGCHNFLGSNAVDKGFYKVDDSFEDLFGLGHSLVGGEIDRAEEEKERAVDKEIRTPNSFFLQEIRLGEELEIFCCGGAGDF